MAIMAMRIHSALNNEATISHALNYFIYCELLIFYPEYPNHPAYPCECFAFRFSFAFTSDQ